MYHIGIDIGYSSVKLAVLDMDGAIVHTGYAGHKGQALDALGLLLRGIPAFPGRRGVAYGAVTGSGGALLARAGAASRANEVAALVEGALLLDDACASIIEVGGQTAKFITSFAPGNKAGVQVSMTSNCSSGTGSFLEEQVSRLGLAIEDYATVAARAASVPRIAGRCSVFAKTDIIHHQQQGVPVPDILAGLARAVVKNYRGAVMRGLPRTPPMLFAGGVALNGAMVDAMRAELGLGPDELRVHEHSCLAGATGAAVLAAKQKLAIDLRALAEFLERAEPVHLYTQETARLEPLRDLGDADARDRHRCQPLPDEPLTTAWLGIDVGSTSTNLVLTDARDRILAYRYLRTAGDPARAVRRGLDELHGELGARVRVAGAGVTGSGRHLIGRMVGADLVRDEITAQARAATLLDPEVDTVFEIGGQDSKYIALKDGVVADFQMNKICAAGTGSFIEEQAKKLGVPLDEIGPRALAARSPIGLGERCTVFMESSIAAHMAHGADTADLAAGLCYSIVKNYMNRVVSNKPVGQRIFLQGGVAHNQGVVNAFRAVTGRRVVVPPFFSVTGAYGAAVLAREHMAAQGQARTAFKGLRQDETRPPAAPPAPAAGRPADSSFSREMQDFIFQGHNPVADPARKTVGMPRALFTFGMFPMFHPFFEALGCNVVLSDPTSEETVRLAQEYSLDETCYPVKLINGHAAQLVRMGVDYIFFPDLFSVAHPGSRARQDYGCPYMQAAFKIINKAMSLDTRGIKLLAPTIAFSRGQDFMREVFMDMGRELGADREQTGRALQAAMRSFKAFEARMDARGKQMDALEPGRKAFVLISKIYGVADPVLNLGIPDKLAALGYQTLPFYALPPADIFEQHPNMYWPFGQHILEAARVVAAHPDLHAIFLTHHGCGPDTVTTHYFKEIMGDKPYLTIEVDEHSSDVGVITRLEAFVGSLEHQGARPGAEQTPAPPGAARGGSIETGLAPGRDHRLLLPDLPPYSRLAAAAMRGHGLEVEPLAPSDARSLDLGRRHTVTNEYYSLTALLGDLLRALAPPRAPGAPPAVLLPQNEGAEVDGQYARFVRTQLDLNGHRDVAVCAPFLEDLPDLGEAPARDMFHVLLAGDLVLLAPPARRPELLATLLEGGESGAPDGPALAAAARRVRAWNEEPAPGKRVFALGEPLVLFNDFLNDGTFRRLEKDGHRVIRAPLSECLWSLWHDHLEANPGSGAAQRRARLDELRRLMGSIGRELGAHSHFEPDPEALMRRADRTLGLYSGAFGRYRSVKAQGSLPAVDGIISVTSMYENTGISLGILRGGAAAGELPHLALTFDGNPNENDKMKTESFIHYL